MRDERVLTTWEFALGQPSEETFHTVHIPHDWAISMPLDKNMQQGASQGYRTRQSIGWYRKKLHISKVDTERLYFLHFGGIYENSIVWVNEKCVGSQHYGYSSFRFDISNEVRTGDNIILIKVDNTALPVDRWYSGCGIYRPILLVSHHRLYLDDREIYVNTAITGRDAEVTVYVRQQGIVKASIGDAIDENNTGILNLHIENVIPWSAENPYLYSLNLELYDGYVCVDNLTLRIGIRDVVFDPCKGLLINGIPTKLKGVCMHQDAGCCGIAVTKEIWRERLLLLKEMGINSIRPSHHTFSTNFLDLCDEMGFYVYEECFDKWMSGLYGRYFPNDWQNDVTAMVKRDRNRPSIIIWGVGNEVENQGQSSMLEILKMLVAYVKNIDSSRPVTYAMNPHFKRETNIDARTIEDIQAFVDEEDDTEIYEQEQKLNRIEAIANYVDIIACNYQEHLYPAIHGRIPNKLILGTEVYQYFMGHEKQLQNFSSNIPSTVPEHTSYVIGSMIWSGFDYLGESMDYPSKGWSGAPIRTNNIKKPAFYMFKSLFSQVPTVHFCVLDTSLTDEYVKEHWNVPPFADHWDFPQVRQAIIPYAVFTNCQRVSLFINEKQYHIPSGRIIMGYLPYHRGKVKVIGYNGGIAVCQHELITPKATSHLVFEDNTAHLQKNSEYLFTVHARDLDGNHCYHAQMEAHFTVEGEARILGVDNGCLMNIEPYNECKVSLFQGSASVLLHIGKYAKQITVTASAQGLIAGKLILEMDVN